MARLGRRPLADPGTCATHGPAAMWASFLAYSGCPQHDDHVVADAMPEGAASPEVITPKLVSAPSWSIEIWSGNPCRSSTTDPNVATRPRRHPRCESGYLEERRRARS